MIDQLSSGGKDAAEYPELRKWVVGCLSGHKKVNDIIYQLCQRTGWDWNTSRSFVEQITQIDQKEVHKRRLPILVMLGFFILAGGFILAVPAFFDMIDILSGMQPPFDFEKLFDMFFLARVGFLTTIRLVSGMAMVVAGGWGIVMAIRSAVTGEGDDLMKSGPLRNS
jgi:hypothetical protein